MEHTENKGLPHVCGLAQVANGNISETVFAVASIKACRARQRCLQQESSVHFPKRKPVDELLVASRRHTLDSNGRHALKLDRMEAARSLADLAALPCIPFEALVGDRTRAGDGNRTQFQFAPSLQKHLVFDLLTKNPYIT